GPAPGSLRAASPAGRYDPLGAVDPSVEDLGLCRRAGDRHHRSACGAFPGAAPRPRSLGGRRRLLATAVGDAGAAPAITPRTRRLHAIRALRRRHARGTRVLHPESDRLDIARDREETARPGLSVAPPTVRCRLWRDRAWGGGVSFPATAARHPRRLPVITALSPRPAELSPSPAA